MSMYEKIKLIPLDELETPKTGYRVIAGYYWVVKDGCAMSYGLHNAPQCNMNEGVAKRLQEKLYPDAEVVQIPVAFWSLEQD